MRIRKWKHHARNIARWHARVAVFLFISYLSLGLAYDPEFLLFDIRDRFRALADDITVMATVLGPPQAPVLSGVAVCDTDTGTLSVDLDWGDDVSSETYDIDRDSAPLITGVTVSEYQDTAVTVATSYDYQVTANGPMSPFTAVSNVITVTTPSVCDIILPPPTVDVTAFAGFAVGSYTGTPSTTDRTPEFSGTSNIANAVVDLVVNSEIVISAQVIANVNGYWSWQPATDLALGEHTLGVTATDPLDGSRTVSDSFTFLITETPPVPISSSSDDSDDDDDGGSSKKKKKATVTAPVIPLPIRPTSTTTVPIDFSLILDKSVIYQGDDVIAAIILSRLERRYADTSATLRLVVTDSSGMVIATRSRDIVLSEGLRLKERISLESFLSEGDYRLTASIILPGYDISREAVFGILSKPIIQIGPMLTVTYPELLSVFGTVALWLLLLFLFWVILFGREYWLFIHSSYRITERSLAKRGFFGTGKEVSR